MENNDKNNFLRKKLVGKEDINFPEFCLGVLTDRKIKGLGDKLIYNSLMDSNSVITVIPSQFGYPNQSTRDLYRSLMRITFKKNQFQSRRVVISAREILKELGQAISGGNLTTLKKNLRILRGTMIEFENGYFDKKKGLVKDTINFGILSGFRLREVKRKSGQNVVVAAEEDIAPDIQDIQDIPEENVEKELDEGWVVWNEVFFEYSLKEGRNLINYNYSYYISLKTSIAKELYLLLNKRAYKKDIFRIKLKVLAFEKIGITRNLEDKLFKVRQLLRRAHKELLDTGFLEKEPVFEKLSDGEYIKYFFKHRQISIFDSENDLLNTEDEQIPVYSGQQLDVSKNLEEIGFTYGEIGKLIQKYDIKKLEDALDLMSLSDHDKKIRSKKKWMHSCLNQDFSMEDLLKEREENKKKKIAEDRRKREEAIKRKQEAEIALKNENITNWIEENPRVYKDLCEEYLGEIKSKNNFSYTMVQREAYKNNISELEAIKKFDASIRSLIFDVYLNPLSGSKN